MTVVDEPTAGEPPAIDTDPAQLPGYAQAYREALEITEAYRTRLPRPRPTDATQ